MNIYTRKRGGMGLMKVAMRRVSNDIILLYRLTREYTTEIEPGYCYNISVTKVDCGGCRRQVRCIPDVSRSRGEAERIFQLVCRGCVMPEDVEEIIGEIISI